VRIAECGLRITGGRAVGREENEEVGRCAAALICGGPAIPPEYRRPLFPVVAGLPWAFWLGRKRNRCAMRREVMGGFGWWSALSVAASLRPSPRNQRPGRGRERSLLNRRCGIARVMGVAAAARRTALRLCASYLSFPSLPRREGERETSKLGATWRWRAVLLRTMVRRATGRVSVNGAWEIFGIRGGGCDRNRRMRESAERYVSGGV